MMRALMKAYTPAIASLLAVMHAATAEPLLTTWNTALSGQYARIYTTKAEALAGTGLSTWTGQTLPAYTDIQKVESSADWVYVNTTGLASHRMGPWFLNAAKTTLFPNLPRNQNVTNRFPRVATVAATKAWNYLGSLGRWVNGVSFYNMLDGAFYNNGAETQDGGQGVQTSYWVRNAMAVEVVTFDNTNGHQPPTGDYHYHASPGALRYQLGDNISFTPGTGSDNAGVYTEDTAQLHHSPILAWSYDGYPVYGPYGYSNPTVSSTDPAIRRIKSGFVKRDGTNGTDNLVTTGRVALAKWAASMRGLTTTGTTYPITDTTKRGPAVTATYVIGYWVEDFAFLGDLGSTQGTDFDLDIYNGRFCRTPEYPQGTYAYFVTLDANNQPAFPYAIGRQWYGNPTGGAVTAIAGTTTVLKSAGPASDLSMDPPAPNTSAGTITLTWNSVEGGKYTLQSSTDLKAWNPVETGLTATGVKTVRSPAVPSADTKQFYRAKLDSLSTYDSTGSAGTGGGGGAVPGTGTAAAGYVFSFADGPPMANLISNLRVGTITGIVVAYAVNGPMGGTITISFDNSTMISGQTYTASFGHSPPGAGASTAMSTNNYRKP